VAGDPHADGTAHWRWKDVRRWLVTPNDPTPHFATLRAALNAAVRQRRITWNPASGVELDSAEVRERQRWTPVQAAQFIAATAGEPMGLMFRVAVLRGCRRGELCGFRWAVSEMDKPYRDPATGEARKGAVLTDGAAHRPARREAPRVEAQDAGRQAPGVPRPRHGRTAPRTPYSPAQAMQDAGVDQEMRMREVGHAAGSVNDRYTHPLEQAHLAASEQTAALVRNAVKAS
jgi:integrase